jgi:transcriptional regulator with XRE-family HTH domain
MTPRTEPRSRPQFGNQLRAARLAAGLSIAELARQVGTSRAVIHSYEKMTCDGDPLGSDAR